jgi:hypothetical protein
VPKIIEVEVPVIIYKIKEMVIKYEESDLFHNIDEIITKYSKPYEDIYENNKESSDIVAPPSLIRLCSPKDQFLGYRRTWKTIN